MNINSCIYTTILIDGQRYCGDTLDHEFNHGISFGPSPPCLCQTLGQLGPLRLVLPGHRGHPHLPTQSFREVEQIMSTYVGIVRSNLRLVRAMNRLEILYRETEHLFEKSVVSREICELRNVISVAYIIIKQALLRKESRGLHFTVDYPERMRNEL